MSIAYCGVNLLGTGLGPFLVGFLNERLFGGGATLGVCMAAVGLSDHRGHSVREILLCFHAAEHRGQVSGNYCLRRAAGLMDGSGCLFGFS